MSTAKTVSPQTVLTTEPAEVNTALPPVPENNSVNIASERNKVLVSMQNLGFERDGKPVLHSVSLQVQKGEITTIIGPNGAGKSTLAKLLLGIIKPTHGTITKSRDLQVGYVPQRVYVDWTLPLTVKRFMTLTYSGFGRKDAVADALEAVGMEGFESRPVQSLSGGEFQRILLARALIRKPNLLVLDEPVQGIDFAGEALMYDLIASIRRQTGCSIFLISHDLHVVMARTDHVVCLDKTICCSGKPETVSKNQAYRDLFAGGSNGLALYRHPKHHIHDETCQHDGCDHD
jgi:zinc transport system ATP-binding protein